MANQISNISHLSLSSSGVLHDDDHDYLSLGFRDLEGIVPNASLDDEQESVLARAIAYIRELELRLESLERDREADRGRTDVKLRVWGLIVYIEANWEDARYPSARLLRALQELDAKVEHASMAKIEDRMVQGVAVRVPAEMAEPAAFQEALLAVLDA